MAQRTLALEKCILTLAFMAVSACGGGGTHTLTESSAAITEHSGTLLAERLQPQSEGASHSQAGADIADGQADGQADPMQILTASKVGTTNVYEVLNPIGSTLNGVSTAAVQDTESIPSTIPTPLPTSSQSAVDSHTLDSSIDFDAGEYLLPSLDGQFETLGGITPIPFASPPGLPYDRSPGTLTIQYQGGDSTERLASLVSAPGSTNNRALRFWLQSPNVRDKYGQPYKSRIQMNAYDINKIRAREVRLSTRMYLGTDFELLRARPKTLGWLAVSEWWNNADWTGEEFPFRIAVHVVKPSALANSPLYFRAYSETFNTSTQKYDRVWTETNNRIEVPLGKWVTLEYYFREGNADEGRFYLAMIPDGAERQVLIDVHGWTYHPSDPFPNGITHINPAKLYTDIDTVSYVRDHGGTLQIFWDSIDFRFCRERFPIATSPCALGI